MVGLAFAPATEYAGELNLIRLDHNVLLFLSSFHTSEFLVEAVSFG